MRSRRSRSRHPGRRTVRSPLKRAVLVVATGIALTLASSAVKQTSTARYGDIDACVHGCTVAAAGWPLPYVVDYPMQSGVAGASLAGAVRGVDRWKFEALALDLLVWSAIAAAAAALLRRMSR